MPLGPGVALAGVRRCFMPVYRLGLAPLIPRLSADWPSLREGTSCWAGGRWLVDKQSSWPWVDFIRCLPLLLQITRLTMLLQRANLSQSYSTWSRC